jgi:hypothetical protein
MKDPVLQPLWKRGFDNEVGRLFQSIRDIQGTNTCFFIELKNNPKDRQITDGKILCHYKPHKKGKEWVRITAGGDRLDYSCEVATYTAGITPFNILINITLSKKDAEIMMININNYYLGTRLTRYEYMHMLLPRFSEGTLIIWTRLKVSCPFLSALSFLRSAFIYFNSLEWSSSCLANR